MTVSGCMSITNISKSNFVVLVLQINFDEDDYSIDEDETLNTDIRFQFSQNQNSFTVHLCAVSIDDAQDMGLGYFIDSDTINNTLRATAGSWLIYIVTHGACAWTLSLHYLVCVCVYAIYTPTSKYLLYKTTYFHNHFILQLCF